MEGPALRPQGGAKGAYGGQVREVELADGSRLQLNGATSIDVADLVEFSSAVDALLAGPDLEG